MDSLVPVTALDRVGRPAPLAAGARVAMQLFDWMMKSPSGPMAVVLMIGGVLGEPTVRLPKARLVGLGVAEWLHGYVVLRYRYSANGHIPSGLSMAASRRTSPARGGNVTLIGDRNPVTLWNKDTGKP